ncbi:MAG: carbamate kinase [Planctomycetes bacterium]|nr:carbamate kinase [Planctomycetota bacterium]
MPGVRQNLMVVALGGNAITQPDQEGRVEQQFANSRTAARALADLVVAGNQLLVTHGNGPQIGNFLLRNEAAAGLIYPLAMEVAVAHVQGGMGFMIAQTLTNELAARGDRRIVTAVVTTVLVDRDDPSFRNPTKPVGRELTREEAQRFAQQDGWSIKEVAPGRYRRVVPSPLPQRIMEIEHLRRAVAAGEILVACGGGGVPVVQDPVGGLCGVRAVIDKDLASALLAAQVDADAMLILTGVDRVRINYGKPDERGIERMTVAEARRWLEEGQFPPGSMGPKIQAAIQFLTITRRSAARVLIGDLYRAADVVAGRTGTIIMGDGE